MKQLVHTYDADLMIAGGSTAGLATAIYARLAGLSCIVVEPRSGTFEKACGEGLMPAVVPLLTELGIDLQAMYKFAGIRYVSNGTEATCNFPRGYGLGVRRIVLHELMQKRAIELGVQFINGKVKDFSDSDSGVHVLNRRVRWLVGCDGLHSRIRSHLVGEHKKKDSDARFGLRRHYEIAVPLQYVEVHWEKDFELYITPVSEHVVNVAVLFNRGRPFDEFLAAVPEVSSRLGKPLTKALGAGPFRQERFAPESGNVFLAGDAAGFLDPITGEGNQLAISAARSLVSSLAAGTPAAYRPQFYRLIRNYWYLTSMLLQLAKYKRARRLIVPLLNTFPLLFRTVLKMLSDPAKLQPLNFLQAPPPPKGIMLEKIVTN